HGAYGHFRVADPKPRDIHKANVRDRLLHRALYRKLYPFFDRTFITDSFSCQIKKGTHRALNRFRSFTYKVSKNHTKTCWVLKCDIRKFFANIDHEILFSILARYIHDTDIFALLKEIIRSFRSYTHSREWFQGVKTGVGLPLGNLTSQLLVNIYMP
ncbi:MAG: RNA-directed DNA polymerase, partial [Parcubacteria group bacterium Gr01-1014_72]